MPYWTDEEIALLGDLINAGKTLEEIVPHFPRHSWNGIRWKVSHYSQIKREPIKPISENIEAITDVDAVRILEKENAQLKSEIKKLADIVFDYNYIAEKIKQYITPFTPPPIPKLSYKESPKPQEVVGLFSDCQIGQEVEYNEMGGLEEYNFDVFAKRLEFWARKLVRIVELHRKAYSVNILHLWGLGDYCEGLDEKFAWRTADPYKQIVLASDLIANAFRFLAGNFSKVKIIWKRGNHGVLHKHLRFTPANLDMILGHLVKEKLSQCSNIEFEIPEPFWTVAEVQGKKFMLIHGNEIKSWFGFPFYGQERFDVRLTKSLKGRPKKQRDVLQDQEVKKVLETYEYDYLVHGHHHTLAQLDAGMGERICNGAFVGSTPYVLSMGFCNRPSQLIFGVHPEWGITWRYPIRLDRLDD